MQPRSSRAVLFACCVSWIVSAQTPSDLSLWTAESYPAVAGFSPGNWVVASGGGSVTQTANGQPTFFISPFEAMNLQLTGQVTAPAGGDNDLFGFALGFSPGESTNPYADYLLVDWKRGTQNYNFGAPSCTPGSISYVGLAVSRVFGIPTADEFWGHVNLDTSPCSGPGDGLVELARGATLGSTGWVSGQTYALRFTFTATLLEVFVDDVLECSVLGPFTNGRFAFYNFSQGNVTYSAYSTQCVPRWWNFGFGNPGTLGVPTLTLSAPPALGTTFDVQMTSVYPYSCLGFLGYGFQPSAQDLGGGAYLWVSLFDVLIFPITPGLTTMSLGFPVDPAYCGFAVYGQFAHEDPGATLGIALSPGLELVLGY